MDEIEGLVYEQDRMNHLHCIWLNGTAKAVSGFMTTHLRDSLDNILSFLRVSPNLAHVILAYHKEFSLTANYPKGHGEKFRDWFLETYPDEYLPHCERATENKQDLICMGADAIKKLTIHC